MKKLNILLITVFVIAISGCTAIGDIFKGGAAAGIIAVIVVLAIIIWIISLFRGRSN